MPANKKIKSAEKHGAAKKHSGKVLPHESKSHSLAEHKSGKEKNSEKGGGAAKAKEVSASKKEKIPPAPRVVTPVAKPGSRPPLARGPLETRHEAGGIFGPKFFGAQAFAQNASLRKSVLPPFNPPAPHSAVLDEHLDLPQSYGEDQLVALVRDPWWIFTYWEVSPEKVKKGAEQLKESVFREVLRLHDITEVEFNGKNSHFFKDHEIHFGAGNYYLNVWEPNRVYVAELGLIDKNGKYVMLLRSNAVRTPRAEPSQDWGAEWARFSDIFEELFRLSGGLSSLGGRSSMQLLGMHGALHAAFPTSPSGMSPSSPWGGGGKKRDFFLWAQTELILYGGTEPDAKLTVAGKAVKLRADGTFSLRFALPDGEQVLRVHAVSADDQEERAITPIVTKKTV